MKSEKIEKSEVANIVIKCYTSLLNDVLEALFSHENYNIYHLSDVHKSSCGDVFLLINTDEKGKLLLKTETNVVNIFGGQKWGDGSNSAKQYHFIKINKNNMVKDVHKIKTI